MTADKIRYYRDLDLETRTHIWELIASRQYYLMTGSGVSLDSEGMTGPMRSAGKLNADLCELTQISPNKTLQQAYSLLEPGQIESEITKHYSTKVLGETVKALAEAPWRRVYTLNVDNAFELHVRDVMKKKLIDEERFHVINYTDDYRDISPDAIHSLIHLHGSVERPEDGYVFSHSEYAKNISRPNSWMTTLTQLMRAEPFVIAGTTLDETDVTYYLEQRPPANHTFTPEAPSILVEPFPDRLTERLCRSHDFVLFEGTMLEFLQGLTAEFSTLGDAFGPHGDGNYLPADISEKDKIRFEETFEKVPTNAQPVDGTARFLLGADPSWGMIAGNADIKRDIFFHMDRRLSETAKSGMQFFVILDDPGSGKSAILKRLALSYAKKHANVFFFRGREYLEDAKAGEILSKLSGHTYIFADNVADSVSYLIGILKETYLGRVTIIGTERKYRRRYVEDAFAEFDVQIIDSELDLSIPEARRLVKKHVAVGLSDIDTSTEKMIDAHARSLSGDPISIATCRIQNNFFAFDRIVRDLIRSSDENEMKLYAAVGLARYCYAGGVSKSIISSIPDTSRNNRIGDLYSKFPMHYAPGSQELVVPARTAVSERVVEVLKEEHGDLLLEIMVGLANALSTKVNRDEIRRRTPASKLAGGLLDFDRTVQKFINDKAEAFYDEIHDGWSWNSRYWEQLSLLKLDRYFSSRDDTILLQEGIQNARYAYSLERHPLSLTTLAKALFAALEAGVGDRETVFNEAWSMITQSIEIEKNWDRIRSTAFMVCFRGVEHFLHAGGILTGRQSEELRDIVAITHARKLRDRKMQELRDQIVQMVS